ncbi:sensor domain-containing diguanylate cyclase [Cyanobium sp. NIES-981]|uniref:sensor domain-containing diguanylate cyclase n=1 Tax=Cyanobium sp. NIES-981 TaxID=1851505 RepID=UPI001CED0AA4|nr:sensor domain-containing diguanylate cyclase [Cyanobium sp. NIES-981]
MRSTMYPDYPLPADEPDRQRDLERYGVLDSPDDTHFDRLVRLASTVLETPIALISLIDKNRQWFLARHGLDITETPREQAFCAHTITEGEPLVVPDARTDPRFCTNPLVLGEPGIRFYAGAPLASAEGHNLGSLCVIDRQPRRLSAAQVKLLQELADLVVRELELRRQTSLCPLTGLANRMSFLEQGQRELNRALRDGDPMALLLIDIDQFSTINNRWGHQTGDELLRAVAEVCRSQRRPRDLLGRMRDDAFAILMVDTGQDAAMERSEAIRCGIADLQGKLSGDPGLQVSGGLTELTPTDQRIEDLLARAGQALLLAQSSGQPHQIARLVHETRPGAGPGAEPALPSAQSGHGRRGDDPVPASAS